MDKAFALMWHLVVVFCLYKDSERWAFIFADLYFKSGDNDTSLGWG